VKQLDPIEPRTLDVLRPKASARPSLAREGARAPWTDDDRDGAGRVGGNPSHYLDTVTFQLGYQAAAHLVITDPGNETRRLAEAGRPGAEVRGLPPATDPYAGVAVVIGNEIALRGNGHVEQQLADRGDQLRRDLRGIPTC